MRKLLLATALFALPALALAGGSNNSGNENPPGGSSTGTPFSIISSTTATIGSGSQSISSGEATAPLGTTAFAISGNTGVGTTSTPASRNSRYAARRLGMRPACRECVKLATGDFALP